MSSSDDLLMERCEAKCYNVRYFLDPIEGPYKKTFQAIRRMWPSVDNQRVDLPIYRTLLRVMACYGNQRAMVVPPDPDTELLLKRMMKIVEDAGTFDQILQLARMIAALEQVQISKICKVSKLLHSRPEMCIRYYSRVRGILNYFRYVRIGDYVIVRSRKDLEDAYKATIGEEIKNHVFVDILDDMYRKL